MDQLGRSDPFQAGQSFGKFYLVQLIGEGGTSRIFKALQQPINRIVALKIPSFAEAGTILTPDEFLSEATLMARLEHPNVTRIYDFGVHEDKAFICMEFVEGWNLMELSDSRGPFSPAAAIAAGLQTLDGLDCAHSHDVLHLDLSPANVLVSRQGVAKLSDFGMAGKKLRSSEGRIVGTPAFLSPEHVAGAPGNRKSDLFSFGSLLYYLATGEPLFDPGPSNTRVTQALREIESARSQPPQARLRRLPPQLAKAVELALRGEDAEALKRELREAWKKAGGDERPETALRRELGLDGDPLAGPAAEPLPGEQELRARYLALREEGKHREAVALLEKALRSQPDNPLLRELLSLPARAKSGAATMDVGAAPSASPAPGQPVKDRRRAAAIAAGVGILAVTLAAFAWTRKPAPATTPFAAPSSPASVHPIPVDGSRTLTVSLGPDSGPALEDLRAAHGEQRYAGHPAGSRPRNDRASVTGKLPTAVRAHLPPTVALSGPAGTKVSVDDTAEWTSPGPRGGWTVSPGLVNITLTPPGSGRPISSSLFLSADTMYVLSLDGEGGFSVARKRH